MDQDSYSTQSLMLMLKRAELLSCVSPPEAAALALQAQQLAEAQGDVQGAAWALLVYAPYAAGGADCAEVIYESVRACFERWADRRGYLQASFLLAWEQACRGEVNAAWAMLRPLCPEIEQETDPFYRTILRLILSYLTVSRGLPDDAYDYACYALEDARASEAPELLCLVLKNAASILCEVGSYEDALPYFEEAAQLVEQHSIVAMGRNLFAKFASCLLGLGQAERAREVLRPWLVRRESFFGRSVNATFYAVTSQVYAALGDWAGAEQALQLSDVEISKDTWLPVRRNLVRGLLERAKGNWGGAAAAFQRAETALSGIAERDAYFPMQVHLEQAQLYQEMGDYQQACHFYEKYRDAVAFRQATTNRARMATAKIKTKLEQAEQAREAERLQHAQTDSLTGLANREAIRQMGEAMLSDGQQLAVLMLDLNRFQAINEALGPDLGDAVLIAIGSRLKELLGSQLGRMHADQFCLICPDQAALQVVQAELAAAEASTIEVNGEALDFSLSIGVAWAPEHGTQMVTLMRNAEIALRSDQQRQQGWTSYHPQMESAQKRDLTLLSALRKAVDQNELRVFVQPKVRLRDGRVSSAETLIRWQPNMREMVAPVDFIPFAEQTGAISQLTRWMLREAMRLTVRWRRNQLPLQLSVNISTQDLRDGHFVGLTQALLVQTGASPDDIRLEVTESGVMDDPASALAIMEALRALGFSLSIDDFGTGQSSLAYLQKMPVSELKIDRAFVSKVRAGSDAANLLKATIELGHGMGLSVVGEGAETAEEWQLLRSLGCDFAQGWYAAKPMSVAEFEAWLDKNQPFIG